MIELKKGDLIRFKDGALVGPPENRVVTLYAEKPGVNGRSYPKETVFMYLDLWDAQLKTRVYVVTPDSIELHCRFIVDSPLEDYIEVVSSVVKEE